MLADAGCVRAHKRHEGKSESRSETKRVNIMERVPVSSSNIRSIGYDPESMTLEVEFNTCAVYQYQGVAQGDYDALMSAGSIGSYFNANIKTRFPCSKL